MWGFLVFFFPLSLLSHQMGRVGPSCTYWGMHPSPDLSPRRKAQCVEDRSARRDPREVIPYNLCGCDAATSGITVHMNRGENAVLWVWLSLCTSTQHLRHLTLGNLPDASVWRRVLFDSLIHF